MTTITDLADLILHHRTIRRNAEVAELTRLTVIHGKRIVEAALKLVADMEKQIDRGDSTRKPILFL
jgi:hypothetical protein